MRVVDRVSGERTGEGYAAVVVIYDEEAMRHYHQGYGEGPTWAEAITTAEAAAREASLTAGERANPNWAYHDANGRALTGPCDTPGCRYTSKPGGDRHDGPCDLAFDAPAGAGDEVEAYRG